MYIVEMESGKRVEVDVALADNKDLKLIKKSGRFNFNWDDFKACTIYKLVQPESNEMAGLMALIDHSDEQFRFIEVKLLESALENIGKRKKFDRVAGTLLSFACRESFKQGYNGFVFLIPKTSLIPHYINKYGFQNGGRGLVLDQEASQKLIAEFL